VPVLTVVDDIATFDASVHGTASTLQRMWKTLDPENDDEIEEIYSTLVERMQQLRLMTSLSALAISVGNARRKHGMAILYI